MTPRFQADADFNHKIVLALRRREPAIDFMDAQHGGVIGAPDSDVLRISADSGRILVSHDRRTKPLCSFLVTISDSRPTQPRALIIVETRYGYQRPVEDPPCWIWAATDAEEWHHRIRLRPL